MDTDGHGRSLRLCGDGFVEERPGETGHSQPNCETPLPREIQKICISSSANLATVSPYTESQNLLNPVLRFTEISFLRISRVSNIFWPQISRFTTHSRFRFENFL